MNSGKGFSDQIAYEIDTEVQRIITDCYTRAKDILTEHEVQLGVIANKLLEIETLNAKEIRSLFETGEMPAEEEAEDTTAVVDATANVSVDEIGDKETTDAVDKPTIDTTTAETVNESTIDNPTTEDKK